MACIVVVVENVAKSMHKKIPIMLGSKIDFHIRKVVKHDSTLFGCFIIEGYHKQINYFITNNCYNGHVYKTRAKKTGKNEQVKTEYVLKLHKNSITMNLKYDPEATLLNSSPISSKIYDEKYNKNVYIKKKFDASTAMNNEEQKLQEDQQQQQQQQHHHEEDKTPPPPPPPTHLHTAQLNKAQRILLKNQKDYEKNYDQNMIDNAKGMRWIDFIDSCSPYGNGIHKKFSEEEYEDYFKFSIRHAPDLDDLANKTCLTPGTIIVRTLESLIQKVQREITKYDTKPTISNKLTNMMIPLDRVMKTGNMFFALSSKNDTKLMKEFSTIYMPIDGQKLHLTPYLNSKTKRAINSQTKNSQALLFPRDGLDFNCTIEAKEMKSAGENIAPAQFVFSPRKLNLSKVDALLRKYDRQCKCSSRDTCFSLIVVVNTYLTDYKISKCKLRSLKRQCPVLPLMIYGDKYLNINTNGHILMKYSQNYKFFITPHEKDNIWKDAFTSYHHHMSFGPIAMYVPTTMDMNEAAKSVVTTTTIKGRCDILENYFHAMAFINTIGTSNVALIHRIEKDDILVEVSYCEDCNDPVMIPIDLKDPHLRYLKYAEISTKIPLPVNKYMDEHSSPLKQFIEQFSCDTPKPQLKVNVINMPENIKNIFSKFSPNTDDVSEFYGVSYDDIIDDAEETFEHIDNIIKKWYDDNSIFTIEEVPPQLANNGTEFVTFESHKKLMLEDVADVRHRNPKGNTCSSGSGGGGGGGGNSRISSNSNSSSSSSTNSGTNASGNIIFLEKNKLALCTKSYTDDEYRKECTKIDIYKKHPPHMVLYTTFGDLNGGTNEDGIILDQGMVENGPLRLVSLTLNVKFTKASKSSNKTKKSQFVNKTTRTFYWPMNTKTDNILNIGTLKCTEKLNVTKSKNVNIEQVKIGSEYQYYVTYEDTNNYTKTIESYYLESNSTLNFHVRYMCPLGIGTKLSNSHGQKNVISKIADLSSNCAFKRDGTMVKPQVLFSISSVVGRTVASQIMTMACNKDVAFTKNGAIVAPMGFNVHNIECGSKCKKTLVKNDIMTAENGFNSNMLSFTSEVLRKQGPSHRHRNPLHYVQQLHALSSVIIQPLHFDQETLMDAISE